MGGGGGGERKGERERERKDLLHSSDFNERGQFQTSFQNAEALQVIGIISSLDMQIKFQLEMTEMEKQSQQEREGKKKERKA